MTDQFPGLSKGAFPKALTENAIADEAIIVGSPVIEVPAGTGELEPRVEPSAVQGDPASGVVVDGDNRGIYDGVLELGEAATAAGEAVVVCISGYCKVAVNANAQNLSVGSPLTISATDGRAELATTGDFVFGRARQASALDDDFILCEVTKEGQLN